MFGRIDRRESNPSRFQIRIRFCNSFRQSGRQKAFVSRITVRTQAIIHHARRGMCMRRRNQNPLHGNARFTTCENLRPVTDVARNHTGINDNNRHGRRFRLQHKTAGIQPVQHFVLIDFQKLTILQSRQLLRRDINGSHTRREGTKSISRQHTQQQSQTQNGRHHQ